MRAGAARKDVGGLLADQGRKQRLSNPNAEALTDQNLSEIGFLFSR
jgi:hypothetical protein